MMTPIGGSALESLKALVSIVEFLKSPEAVKLAEDLAKASDDLTNGRTADEYFAVANQKLADAQAKIDAANKKLEDAATQSKAMLEEANRRVDEKLLELSTALENTDKEIEEKQATLAAEKAEIAAASGQLASERSTFEDEKIQHQKAADLLKAEQAGFSRKVAAFDALKAEMES